MWTCVSVKMFLLVVSLFVTGNISNSVSGLRIRISDFNVPRVSEKKIGPDGNITRHGFVIDPLLHILKQLNVTYDFIEVNQTQVKQFGLAQALINQVIMNEVDICPYGFIPTPERFKTMDFANSISVGFVNFLVKYPETVSRLWGPVRPFQWPVWCIILASAFFVTIVLAIFNKLIADRNPHPSGNSPMMTHLNLSVTYVTGVVFGQCDNFPSNKLSIRMVTGVWCLMALVLVSGYTGNLIFYLTVPTLMPIVNTFEDVAARSDPRLILDAKSYFAERILNADAGTYRMLGDYLRQHPENLIRIPGTAIKDIVSKDAVYPQSDIITKVNIHEDYARTGKCRMTLSKSLPDTVALSYILTKNSKFTDAINKQLQLIFESGLLSVISSPYIPNIDHCLLNHQENPRLVPLKIRDLYSTFLILPVGFLLAFIFFIADRIKAKRGLV